MLHMFVNVVCFTAAAQEKFMGDFFKEHKNNSEWTQQQKFKMANAAWMESDLRSRIMLARKGHGSIGAD